MFNYLRSSWQKIKKKLNKFIPYLLSFVLFSSPLTVSANQTLIGDGSTGAISFDKTGSALGYGNNRATITKEGYLSISGATSIAYGSNSGSCNVISSSKIDFTDVNSMSLSYEVISSNFEVSDIWFGFGLCANNTDFNPVKYVAANACFPFYSYGGYGQGLSSPIVVDTADVTGEYFIEFGFILPYINNSTVTTIKFFDLILYDSDGDVISAEHILNFGNDDTPGIVEEFRDNLDSFNSVVNQFDSIENSFITDFTSSNDEIKSTLSDYQFSGNLLTCANWVTDRYMDFFDNSGDFKQYFIYPLIMGIVLFFIGRGQVILGNLYRKPYDSTTHTVSTGYTERYSDGSKRSETYTRTIGKGGKLRK